MGGQLQLSPSRCRRVTLGLPFVPMSDEAVKIRFFRLALVGALRSYFSTLSLRPIFLVLLPPTQKTHFTQSFSFCVRLLLQIGAVFFFPVGQPPVGHAPIPTDPLEGPFVSWPKRGKCVARP